MVKEILAYDEEIKQKVFKEILDALSFIEPKFVSREEFNKLKWNFLQKIYYSKQEAEKNKKSIDRKDYILYLPEDLNNDDKIIIYNFLEERFSEELWFISWERKDKSKNFLCSTRYLE